MIDYLAKSRLPTREYPFLPQTKGIRRRSKRYFKEWSTHHFATSEFLFEIGDSKNANFGQKDGEKITKKDLCILGAGDLLDFPVSLYTAGFSKIIFTDASLACLRTWKSVAKAYPEIPFSWILCDITGQLQNWQEGLRNNSGSIDDLLNYLRNLPRTNTNKDKDFRTPSFVSSQITISLNILSQLPVYWQECVFYYFHKFFGKLAFATHQSALIEALQTSSSYLIREHIGALTCFKNQTRALITDSSYLFIPKQIPVPNLNSISTIDELIVRISNDGTAGQHTLLRQDALFGVNIEEEIESKNTKIKPTEEAKRILKKATWLWFIDPFGEKDGLREIHQVDAFLFKT